MKTVFTFFAFVYFITLGPGCAHPLAPVGHYQDSPIVADGNADDWGFPLRFSNAEHTFQYSVTNDKKNIYICLISNDPAAQSRMLRSGVSLYFDPKGEKNKNITLEFPIKKTDENANNYGNPIQASGTKSTLDQLLLQSNYFNTIGFVNIENGQYAVGDKKSNIQVALKLHDDSTLVYEAIVPVNDIPGVDPYGKNASKNFSVGISVTSTATRNNNNYNNSPRPSFGMRGMRMGGGGGGYRGGSQRNQPPKEQVEWYQFRLAFSNAKN
jgi:hypothetical protein